MSILSKEALDKIRTERPIMGEEDTADVAELCKRLAKVQREKKQEEQQENEEFNPFL
jgi:hypothetical protein